MPAPAPGTPAPATTGAPATTADAIAQLASPSIASQIEPAATVATSYNDTFDWMSWNTVSGEAAGDDVWRYVCESSDDLQAVCTVELDCSHRVAVHRATLTNNSDRRSRPMNELAALCLQLKGVTRRAAPGVLRKRRPRRPSVGIILPGPAHLYGPPGF